MAKNRKLVFDSVWCKGCGICVEFCPQQTLELVNGKSQLKKEDRCILCGQCEQRCPDYAIYLKEVDE